MKIQSQSYITYLQTIANLQQATAEDKTEIHDIIARHTAYNEEIILSDRSQTEKLDIIRQRALLIEQMNQFQIALDLRYARFYFSDKPGLQFKQQHFDRFAINELDRCGIRRAYVFACEYKLLFLALFGLQAQTIGNFRSTKQITQQQYDTIIELYAAILNIWSRFHDYIFYICMTECGYENTYERIRQSENKRQYFEPLRSSLFQQNSSVEQSQLYAFYKGLGPRTPLQGQVLLCCEISQDVPKYPAFSTFAAQFYAPTTQQILQACQAVRPGIFQIETAQFDQRFCQARQEALIAALFHERILYADPLQTRICDQSVDLLGTQSTLSQQPAGVPPMQVIPPNTVHGRQAHHAQAQAPQQAHPTPHPVSHPASPAPPAHQKHQKTPVRTQTYISDEAQARIEAQPLDYYRQPRESVEKFVREMVRMCIGDITTDLDQLLFINSSCQKEKANVWGRLYSFLIAEAPPPLEQLTEQSKHQFDEIKAFAVENLGVERNIQNQQLFEQIEARLTVPQPGLSKSILNEIEKMILQFIEWQLNIAYYHAFYLRDDFIKGSGNHKVKKESIHKALQSIQIMNKGPLNKLMQQQNAKNKRKMALATFIFLSNGEKQ